ncbi:cysteine-rich receptor-like protein kinase [Tanacetum coccineum]|uniref:Cysteine-rich receptor-like protein kinase n=1 Tax=Tanacetum coccineum TaxID=301880 RepID=A0ABQ5DKI0_9ASTR
MSHDAILLRVFSFTLTGTAKRWVDRLTPGAINTWDLLKKAFIQRYCPPSKIAKRLEDIHNFKQEIDESLYQAWERFNDLLYKCLTHDINSHQKGPIPGMTPTQALTAIQTMADHSQKWHDGTLSRSLNSSSNTDRRAAIVSKLYNLGCDMKKMKENVHTIQVGCQICEGPHLDKECPLNEEVKQVEEAKYGEFRLLAPFNGSNGAKYSVGPPRYYTRTNNRPPYGEKRPSLEELMNKHLEESARRRRAG